MPAIWSGRGSQSPGGSGTGTGRCHRSSNPVLGFSHRQVRVRVYDKVARAGDSRERPDPTDPALGCVTRRMSSNPMSVDNVVRPTRRGLGLLGWVLVAVVMVASVANFVRIDSASHSASDTLINWVPQTAILVVVGLAIAFAARRRAGRKGA